MYIWQYVIDKECGFFRDIAQIHRQEAIIHRLENNASVFSWKYFNLLLQGFCFAKSL